jgi:hypothetical protein
MEDGSQIHTERYRMILSRPAGLFSLVFQAVGQAWICEKKRIIPIAYFNKNCLYWVDTPVNSSRNVWEYFFEPLSSARLSDLFSTNDLSDPSFESFEDKDFLSLVPTGEVEFTNEYPDVIKWSSSIVVQRQRRFVNNLIRRYLRLKPHIRSRVKKTFLANKLMGNKLIGVHFRGSEKDNGKNRDGSAPVRIDGYENLYFRATSKEMKANPEALIFLATDSQSFADNMISEFGSSVIMQDSIRAVDGQEEITGLHFLYQGSQNGRQLGEEVLTDAVVLSKCQSLIHGMSNVSHAALYFNPDLKSIDIDRQLMPKHEGLVVDIKRRLKKVIKWG